MKARTSFIALSLLACSQIPLPASAQATFSTLAITPLAIEGLTNDNSGNLYTTERGGNPCRVLRVNIANPVLAEVGRIPAPCSPSGIVFDRAGKLYVADGDEVLSFTPNAAAPPTATVFATGVNGTNGLAFDENGNLWTGDGTQGNGRVWRIPPTGGPGVEMFRVQPMVNSLGIGRNAVTKQTTPDQNQPLVANGIQFTKHGDMLIADTARGAIWRVELNRNGDVISPMGCDTTFSANTLCLDNIWVQHSLLEGADGIVLDRDDNVWVDANERNAVIFVSDKGKVEEVFRNPPDATTQLRNGGTVPAAASGFLETPTSPALSNITLCTANSDGGRRDNSPASGGELPSLGGGKISCMDQKVKVRGATLPVRHYGNTNN